MPETPKKDHGPSLPDRLVSDPKNPPELTLLQGWLGASSEDRCRRLYLDPALAQSIEIPEDAIVHTLEIPATTSPLGGHWVWVKADAAITHGPGIERAYARVLKGQIQQDVLAGAAVARANLFAGMIGAPITTSLAACTPIVGINFPVRAPPSCPATNAHPWSVGCGEGGGF